MIYDINNCSRFCSVTDTKSGEELTYVVSVDTEREIVTRYYFPLRIHGDVIESYETPCKNIRVTHHKGTHFAQFIELELSE